MPPNSTNVATGTKLMVVPFNASVELVMHRCRQYTIEHPRRRESHLLHLHGFNFFMVGQGYGNYDPVSINLVDPAERNTVGMPAGGWVAIQFRADNPGVYGSCAPIWRCTQRGASDRIAWVVLDGRLPHQKGRNCSPRRLIFPNAN